MLLPSKIDKLALNNLIKSYNPKIIFSKSISKIKHKNFIKKKNYYDYEILINKNKTYKIKNDSLFLLLSTSGSTGSAKNVKISHENLIFNTTSIINSLKMHSSNRCITTMPKLCLWLAN